MDTRIELLTMIKIEWIPDTRIHFRRVPKYLWTYKDPRKNIKKYGSSWHIWPRHIGATTFDTDAQVVAKFLDYIGYDLPRKT